jgi:hypothetical protein
LSQLSMAAACTGASKKDNSSAVDRGGCIVAEAKAAGLTKQGAIPIEIAGETEREKCGDKDWGERRIQTRRSG